MYKGNLEAWGKIGRAEGLRGIFTGWSPTFFGYSVGSYEGTLIWRTLNNGRPKARSNTVVMNSLKSSTPI